MAAMAVCFLLLVVLVQAAFLLVARQTATAAAEAAARAAARPGAVEVEEEILARLLATVPGAVSPQIDVVTGERSVTASVSFEWLPPGPDLVPITVVVRGTAPLVASP